MYVPGVHKIQQMAAYGAIQQNICHVVIVWLRRRIIIPITIFNKIIWEISQHNIR